MTPKERLGAVLTGQIPDRVPVFCNLLEQGAAELGLSIKEYYSSGENVAEGQLRLQEKFGYDQLWGLHYLPADAEMLGASHTLFYKDGPPNVGQLIIRDEADIDKLSVNDAVFETPPAKRLDRTLDILKSERGSECPILGCVIGSASMPPLLMGMEKWLDLLYMGSPGTVRKLLEKCSDFCRRKISWLFEGGVDAIAYMNPLGSASFIRLDQFESDSLLWLKRDLRDNGPAGIVYFNGGGLINPFIPLIQQELGIGAYYINPLDDVAEAKQILQGKGILAAPINDIPLISQSEEQIRYEVKRIMNEGAGEGGFIFGTLVMPCSIGEDKIKVMLEAAIEYGRY